MYGLMGYAHSQLLRGPKIPIPTKAPNSKDIVNKTHDAGDWLSVRSQSFWVIILILIVAAVITSLMKRPFVRGMIVGLIILAVVIAAMRG